MKTYDEMSFHPTSERLVEILCAKTQNQNPLFFRVIVGYYFCKAAASMRVTINTPDRGKIPVNMYALALSPSGTGKGVSTGIIEKDVMGAFRHRFLEETFPLLAEKNLPKLSNKRAARKGTDPDDELARTNKEFDQLGSLLFDFSEATSPAVKQMRHKLLMADAGAVNMQIDEIGSNLVGSMDVLTTFLELYDVGETKQKLVKNTTDSARGEEIKGSTPTNLLMFGEPVKLLNGSKTEEEFYSMMETGYARRCFFCYCRSADKVTNITPEQLYEMRTNRDSNQFIEDLASQMEDLADSVHVGRSLGMSREISLLLNEYEIFCNVRAAQFNDHEDIKKKEMMHRYFKALKLAGAYAFIDDSADITEDHLYYAIKLAEESGMAFSQLLSRDRPYVKLAKYISSAKRDVTQADMVEDLPFYRGGAAQKSEMLMLAIAYGYKNNIIIKRAVTDGIEFLRGETLKETDTSKMIVSYSGDVANDYRNEIAPWEQLHVLTQHAGLHWCSHHMVNGHRAEEDAIPGCNMIVVDVDGGTPISTVKLLLSKYKFMIYTTKRHTDLNHRFRIIFPINYELSLDAKDFKEMMTGVFDWLPFEVDRSTNQRARKWLSHNGQYEYNDGEILDILPFIPKTSKDEERRRLLNSQASMDSLERWVMNNIGDGNRNNMILRYAMILLDAGFTFGDIKSRVLELNGKLPDKLDEAEILGTVMVTVGKRLAKQP